MDDAFLVRGRKPVGDLHEERKSFVHWQGTRGDAFCQSFARYELHHQKTDAAGFLEAVKGGDVGMVERSKQASFTFEAG